MLKAILKPTVILATGILPCNLIQHFSATRTEKKLPAIRKIFSGG
jgi:hypothetical protein